MTPARLANGRKRMADGSAWDRRSGSSMSIIGSATHRSEIEVWRRGAGNGRLLRVITFYTMDGGRILGWHRGVAGVVWSGAAGEKRWLVGKEAEVGNPAKGVEIGLVSGWFWGVSGRKWGVLEGAFGVGCGVLWVARCWGRSGCWGIKRSLSGFECAENLVFGRGEGGQQAYGVVVKACGWTRACASLALEDRIVTCDDVVPII